MMSERDRISIREREIRSRRIESQLIGLQAYQNAEIIFVYVSFRSEVDTKSFIRKANEDGKRIAVPVSIPNGKILLPCEISGLDDLVPGTWGILEPDKDRQRLVDSRKIDLAVVPGLAFDHFFQRLGYGAGYYDRFLPSLREDAVKLGIGYDFQLIDRLPVEKYDIPLDGILTDIRLLVRDGVD
jgi:5-formyltetrahydrofolate cyclo-ligase